MFPYEWSDDELCRVLEGYGTFVREAVKRWKAAKAGTERLRRELDASTEYHVRCGKMIEDTLGDDHDPNQETWRFQGFVNDIIRLRERAERQAEENVSLKEQANEFWQQYVWSDMQLGVELQNSNKLRELVDRAEKSAADYKAMWEHEWNQRRHAERERDASREWLNELLAQNIIGLTPEQRARAAGIGATPAEDSPIGE